MESELEFIDYEEEPDDIEQVNDYGRHKFEDYYYSSDNNRFYLDTGVNYRVLPINFDERNGHAFVTAINNLHIKVKIYFTEFKSARTKKQIEYINQWAADKKLDIEIDDENLNIAIGAKDDEPVDEDSPVKESI